MKTYEKSDVDEAFATVLRLIDDGADAQDLRTFGGLLAITIASRMEQLSNGTAKSSERNLEISKLKETSSRLRFKLNRSTVEEIAYDVIEAYKVYALQ